MFNTLEERKEFVNTILEFMQSKFDLSDTQIFIFGSFLTNRYIPGQSDIDIGIYSENNNKSLEMEYDLDRYLTNHNIDHDIVGMRLNEKMPINISIMTYGTPITDYESEEMFKYLVNMIKKYGTGILKLSIT